MWVAWHLKGAAGTPGDWLLLTNFDRAVITRELNRRIAEHNAAIPDF